MLQYARIYIEAITEGPGPANQCRFHPSEPGPASRWPVNYRECGLKYQRFVSCSASVISLTSRHGLLNLSARHHG